MNAAANDIQVITAALDAMAPQAQKSEIERILARPCDPGVRQVLRHRYLDISENDSQPERTLP